MRQETPGRRYVRLRQGEKVPVMAMVMTNRANTSERWQAALRRARAEGVQVRQLAGCGMWISTSASDPSVAYEVTPWSCECHAGQFGDPVCKHRAALLATLGRLRRAPEPTPAAKCSRCNGAGSILGTPAAGRDESQSDAMRCEHCHGTGQADASRAA